MDGSIYNDGILVDASQLNRTELTKSEQILRTRTDVWEIGVHTGFLVTPNPVNTGRVDVALGTGYAVNGEFVESLTDQLNLQLSDSTLGATNWVVAFYTETKTSVNPHETNGTTQPSEARRAVRIRILTPVQFNALPLSDLSFATDAQDRALLLAIVTATGGALTTSNIENSPPWRSIKYAIMSTPPLSGVTIAATADSTPEGSGGLIKFETGPNRLSWQAPTEIGFGSSVNVPADGFYTLTAVGGSTIQVYVVVSGLPISSTTIQVLVQGLYSQIVPRMSSTDRHHRSMLGTGIPSPSNPHGLSISDISPDFVTDMVSHQRLMHANGIWRGSSVNCLKPIIDEAVGADRLLIAAPAGIDCYWIDGKRLTSINNTVLEFPLVSMPSKKSLLEIYVNNSGDVRYSQRLEHTGVNFTGSDNGIVYVNEHVTAGLHKLSWLALGPGAGGYLAWDDSRTRVKVLPGTASGLYQLRNGKQTVWVYIANLSELPSVAGTYDDVITVNAAVNSVEDMQICQVFYGGNADGRLGYTNIRGTNAALLVDTRQFGTLRDFHLRDDTIRDVVELPEDEHHASGVCIGRYDLQGAYGSLWVEKPGSGLTLRIWGQAPVYVRGRRHVVGSGTSVLSATVPDNAVTVIYVDIDGNIAQIPFVYAATLLQNQPDALDSVKAIKTLTANYASYLWVHTGAPLAVVSSAGGNVTHVVDMRRNLSGGNVNIRPWTVGSIAPIYLFPAWQAVEFYSIDTAMLYALVQGQERLECVYATLSNPTLIPYQIPALKNFVLTGTLFIDRDWSSLSAVFELQDGADITFEDLQMFLGASFVGGAGLSLVQTSTGATSASNVSFTNCEIDWSLNGPLVRFIAAGPSDCSLHVNSLTVTGAPGAKLFQVDKSARPLDIQGVVFRDLAGPLALVGASVDVNVSCINVAGNAVSSVVSLSATKVLSGAFSNVSGFNSFLESATTGWCRSIRVAGSEISSFNVEDIQGASFSACKFASLFQVGSSSHKASQVTLSSCECDDVVRLFADSVSASACRFTSLFFGGASHQYASCQFSVATHSNWAASNIQITGCTFGVIQHDAESTALTDMHITGCSFDQFRLLWGAENINKIVVSSSKIGSRVLMRPTVMPSAVKSLKVTIDNCDMDFTSFGGENINLAFCKDVRITSNRIRGIASFEKTPILLGQGFGIFNQEVRNVEISRNEFYVADVNMYTPNLGSPMILVACEQPAAGKIPSGISICDNRFEWTNGADLLKKVTCILYASSVAFNFRVERNQCLFSGSQANTSWLTTSGTIQAHRMALMKGLRDITTVAHDIVLQSGSVQGNQLACLEATPGDSKWIVYDLGSVWPGSVFLALGNNGNVAYGRLYPHSAGLAFTDVTLNLAVNDT